MTCIVGIEYDRGIVIGGDSASTSAGFQHLTNGKVFRLDDMVIGCCGGPRTAQIIRYRLRLPTLDIHDVDRFMACEFADAAREALKESGAGKVNSGLDEMESSSAMLVAVAGRLYTLHSDFQWSRKMAGYAAIGSGRELATGSLHTTGALGQFSPYRRVELALEAACEHSGSCAPPLTIIEHTPKVHWRDT